LQYIRTTRFGDAFASLKISLKYWTALRPKLEPVGKLR